MPLNTSALCKASPLNGSVVAMLLCLKCYQRGGKVRARGRSVPSPKVPRCILSTRLAVQTPGEIR